MTLFPLRTWRVTLGHESNPIVKICLASAPGFPHFYPVIIPLETAEAIWGKEKVDLIGETAVRARLTLEVEDGDG